MADIEYITELQFERGNVNRKSKFKTCEGDSIYMIADWRDIREEVVSRSDPLFEFGDVFEDGESDLQDSKRILRYFYYKCKKCPLTEFGIIGTDYGVQVISFEKIIHRQVWGRKLKNKKEIHFINGYCMSEGMEWMLIEIDTEKNRVRIYECDDKCVW